MVSTRGKLKRERGSSTTAIGGSSEDQTPGSIPWFRDDQGLNATGFIPGTNLLEEHVSRAEYNAFWGPTNYNNGARYKRKVSRRMVRRIRFLFQRVLQRPIGRSDAIPYHFGRGLLAERKGIPIDWAGYARKMTHRGTGNVAHLGVETVSGSPLSKKGKAFVFESMEDLRERTEPNMWPRNEVGPESENEDVGRDDDWQINVIFAMRDIPMKSTRPRRGPAAAEATVQGVVATATPNLTNERPKTLAAPNGAQAVQITAAASNPTPRTCCDRAGCGDMSLKEKSAQVEITETGAHSVTVKEEQLTNNNKGRENTP